MPATIGRATSASGRAAVRREAAIAQVTQDEKTFPLLRGDRGQPVVVEEPAEDADLLARELPTRRRDQARRDRSSFPVVGLALELVEAASELVQPLGPQPVARAWPAPRCRDDAGRMKAPEMMGH